MEEIKIRKSDLEDDEDYNVNKSIEEIKNARQARIKNYNEMKVNEAIVDCPKYYFKPHTEQHEFMRRICNGYAPYFPSKSGCVNCAWYCSYIIIVDKKNNLDW